MTPAEHRAEAERLLELAGDTQMLMVKVPGRISQDQAEDIKVRFHQETGRRPMVLSQDITVNDNSILLQALTHAILGQESA